MSSTPKITLTKDQQLQRAIEQADQMSARMQGQITRQKDGIDRLLNERAEVIQLIQEALAAPASGKVHKPLAKALEVMHVKPTH